MWRSIGSALGSAVLVSLLLGLNATVLAAQTVRPGQADVLTIRGFVGATAFVQHGLFLPGNGQNAKSVSHEELERWWHGGDIRNTRLGMDIRGPQALDRWQTGGTVEVDLFGGFPGAGGVSAEQPLLRLRLAYAQLSVPGTTIRLGQDFAPLLGNIPESVTHLSFPLGFASAGLVGWRFPGIFLARDLRQRQNWAFRVRLAAMRGGWDGARDPQQPTAAQFGLLPQLQARLDAERRTDGTRWNAYIVGHLDRKDLEAAGIAPRPRDRLTGWAFAAGARTEPSPLTLHGNVYVGRAIGQQLGHMLQYGDIIGWGGWLQGGWALNQRWSIWSFAGIDDPRDEDFGRTGRLRNRSFNQMLRLQDGPVQIGLEWMHARTLHRRPVPPAPAFDEFVRKGDQIALSLRFSF